MSSLEESTTSVCQIKFGVLEAGQERPSGFCGIDDFENTTTVIGFRNDDDEWIGFAIENGNLGLLVGNSDTGSLDGDTLRGSLPANVRDLWNAVLLSSVDLEELEDEEIKFKLFYRDESTPDEMQPFRIKSALKGSAKSPYNLFTHKVFGEFTFSAHANESFDLNSFLNGNLENLVVLPSGLLGEISDFDTESETFCVIPLNKDREPIES